MYSIPFCRAGPSAPQRMLNNPDEMNIKPSCCFSQNEKSIDLIKSFISVGVVERASKELSRRFTSFAARTRRGSKHEKLEDITEHKNKEDNSEQVTKMTKTKTKTNYKLQNTRSLRTSLNTNPNKTTVSRQYLDDPSVDNSFKFIVPPESEEIIEPIFFVKLPCFYLKIVFI